MYYMTDRPTPLYTDRPITIYGWVSKASDGIIEIVVAKDTEEYPEAQTWTALVFYPDPNPHVHELFTDGEIVKCRGCYDEWYGGRGNSAVAARLRL